MLIPQGLAAQLDALDELGRLSEAAIGERRHDDVASIVADIHQLLAAISWSLEEADEEMRTVATERLLTFERENARRQRMLIARRETLRREIAHAKRVRRLIARHLRERESRASFLDMRR